MGWLRGLLGALAAFFRDRQLIEAGKAEERAAGEAKVIDEIQVATDARAGAERDVALHPERLRDDDGFKRPAD